MNLSVKSRRKILAFTLDQPANMIKSKYDFSSVIPEHAPPVLAGIEEKVWVFIHFLPLYQNRFHIV